MDGFFRWIESPARSDKFAAQPTGHGKLREKDLEDEDLDTEGWGTWVEVYVSDDSLNGRVRCETRLV